MSERQDKEFAGVDLDRCRRGMAQLRVEGIPRASLIEEAIRRIQQAPDAALREEYLGIKNYAAFGDQREDHRYGYGPRHGSIVFSIGRVDPRSPKLIDGDTIYYLEAYRDFGMTDGTDRDGRPTKIALGQAIREYDRLMQRCGELRAAFERVSLDVHIGA